MGLHGANGCDARVGNSGLQYREVLFRSQKPDHRRTSKSSVRGGRTRLPRLSAALWNCLPTHFENRLALVVWDLRRYLWCQPAEPNRNGGELAIRVSPDTSDRERYTARYV